MMTAWFGLELLSGFERVVQNLTRIFHVWFLLFAGELSYISELTYQRISTANNRRGKCYFSSLPSVKDTQWGCFTSLAGNVDLVESI